MPTQTHVLVMPFEDGAVEVTASPPAEIGLVAVALSEAGYSWMPVGFNDELVPLCLIVTAPDSDAPAGRIADDLDGLGFTAFGYDALDLPTPGGLRRAGGSPASARTTALFLRIEFDDDSHEAGVATVLGGRIGLSDVRDSITTADRLSQIFGRSGLEAISFGFGYDAVARLNQMIKAVSDLGYDVHVYAATPRDEAPLRVT